MILIHENLLIDIKVNTKNIVGLHMRFMNKFNKKKSNIDLNIFKYFLNNMNNPKHIIKIKINLMH